MEKNFCTPQECFEKLFTDSRPYIQNSKGFQYPISVEKQVTATLYYLADEGRLRKMANSFGIEKSKIVKTIRRSFFVAFYFRKFFPCVYLTKQRKYTFFYIRKIFIRK